MNARALLASVAFSVLLAPSAMAEDTERFRLERTDDGYVRMDTRTGQMSICVESDGQMVCRMAAEERAAHENRIDLLEGRIGELAARVDELERRTVMMPERLLPTDEEIERSMSVMEEFFRRFLGIAREFDDGPAPDRT